MATGVYGPYSHTGLIWANVEASDSAPKVKKKNAPVFAMKYGYVGAPTTFWSVRPLPGIWVCFWWNMMNRCAVISARDQQHVQDVQPRNDEMPGERAAEQEERQVGPDDRDGLHDAFEDPQAGPGQQVVGERVAEQALQHAERQQHEPDQPVDLAGLAVGAGEEEPQHVREDRRHEQVRCPVVDLAHQQAAADVEADVERRGVSLAHPYAVQMRVRAVVDDPGHARLEEERQERAGEQQDDEAVEGDLAEQERPVVGKDLLEERAEALGAAEPVIQESADTLKRSFDSHCLSPLPEARPDRLVEIAHRY